MQGQRAGRHQKEGLTVSRSKDFGFCRGQCQTWRSYSGVSGTSSEKGKKAAECVRPVAQSIGASWAIECFRAQMCWAIVVGPGDMGRGTGSDDAEPGPHGGPRLGGDGPATVIIFSDVLFDKTFWLIGSQQKHCARESVVRILKLIFFWNKKRFFIGTPQKRAQRVFQDVAVGPRVSQKKSNKSLKDLRSPRDETVSKELRKASQQDDQMEELCGLGWIGHIYWSQTHFEIPEKPFWDTARLIFVLTFRRANLWSEAIFWKLQTDSYTSPDQVGTRFKKSTNEFSLRSSANLRYAFGQTVRQEIWAAELARLEAGRGINKQDLRPKKQAHLVKVRKVFSRCFQLFSILFSILVWVQEEEGLVEAKAWCDHPCRQMTCVVVLCSRCHWMTSRCWFWITTCFVVRVGARSSRCTRCWLVSPSQLHRPWERAGSMNFDSIQLIVVNFFTNLKTLSRIEMETLFWDEISDDLKGLRGKIENSRSLPFIRGPGPASCQLLVGHTWSLAWNLET